MEKNIFKNIFKNVFPVKDEKREQQDKEKTDLWTKKEDVKTGKSSEGANLVRVNKSSEDAKHSTVNKPLGQHAGSEKSGFFNEEDKSTSSGKDIYAMDLKQTESPFKTPKLLGDRSAFYFERTRYEKERVLTVFLIENTIETKKYESDIRSMIEDTESESDTNVINDGVFIIYGKTVLKTPILSLSELAKKDIFIESGEEKCFYDALVSLKHVVKEYISEKEKHNYKIPKINIIGIGSGTDNVGNTAKGTAIRSFYILSYRKECMSKYLCLSEENLAEMAEIGFHSIGAVPKREG